MGCHVNLTKDKYPEQGDLLGKEVEVCFHYDTSSVFRAVCIRDDIEAPFETIFQLVDCCSVVRGAECQYQPYDNPLHKN